MTRREIVEELERLPIEERLAIAEAALHLIREELRKAELSPAEAQRNKRLAAAAESLLADYSTEGELTIFKALDAEDFRGAR